MLEFWTMFCNTGLTVWFNKILCIKVFKQDFISGGVPVESQENIIIDDLLYVFSGVPGNYIVHQPVKDTFDPRTFLISDDLDDALKQIVQQMLPLASNYSIVRRFIEHCNMWSGQVLHALVAAIEILLKDYYVSCFLLK